VRVLLADDHSIVRRGLRGLLEAAGLTVVGEASDGLEAMRLCEEYHPDLLILDCGMPKLSGIEVAARVHKMDHPPGVIILSVHGDESYIMRALGAGARAYLLKSATDEDLIPAVRAVAAGKPYFSSAGTAVLVEDYVRQQGSTAQKQYRDVYLDLAVHRLPTPASFSKIRTRTVCVLAAIRRRHRVRRKPNSDNFRRRLGQTQIGQDLRAAVRRGGPTVQPFAEDPVCTAAGQVDP